MDGCSTASHDRTERQHETAKAGTLAGIEGSLNVDTEIKNLKDLCLKLIDRGGIDSFRPLACIPSTKQLSFMMDQRGLVEPVSARAWAQEVASTGVDFLVAYQSASNKFTIDAVTGDGITSATFEAPDAYV